ncbi:NAD(P)-binding protein [Hypoxylon cercidicola]|nr:NAD(P)-binding protein [Hypoxylon cercidicola]
MVKLDIVRSANAALADATKPVVAVVAGGTAGIGEFTVRAIATTYAGCGDGSLRVYIVGRNEGAARKIIADCEAACPGGSFRFHKGDLSLPKEVDQTPEGLDKYFCLFYYSWMRFVDQLLPLLTASPLPWHVVSVLNASVKSDLILDDMSLRDPRNQGLLKAFAHRVGMTNIFREEVARRNPGKISLSHYHPGNVPTNAATSGNFPWWLKTILTWIVIPLSRPFGVPFEECGQCVLFMASPTRFPARKVDGEIQDKTTTSIKRINGLEAAEGMDGEVGSGAYRVTRDGDAYPREKRYGEFHENGIVEMVYQHTVTAFAEIEAGRAFRD